MTGLLENIRAALTALRPASKLQPFTISTYGEAVSGVSSERMKQIVQWVIFSIFQYQYRGASHLAWLHPELDTKLNRMFQRFYHRGELVLGYRCGDRMPPPPSGFYWRLMPEHNSLRIYQLQMQQDE